MESSAVTCFEESVAVSVGFVCSVGSVGLAGSAGSVGVVGSVGVEGSGEELPDLFFHSALIVISAVTVMLSPTPIVTTHFDYHSIDHNLLKLDILGHDDPTMIRFLNDCTGLDPKDVPLDDKNVMELFMSTDSIGITPEQIGETKLGCLGIPEFGTDFAMNMVIDAKPTSFSDLIRISGLSHGTDVWVGNANTLIEEGTATLESCICCRDDIMVYLIIKGMDKSLSFKTMESVRKGKGLTPEMEEAMDEMGMLGNLPQSSQISIFDFLE